MEHNRLSLIGCVAVVTGLIAVGPALAGSGGRVTREEKRVVGASGKTSINIKNPRGRTVVVGKEDATSVTVVSVKAAQGRDDDETRAMLDKLHVDVSEHGTTIEIETRDDNSWNDGSSLWSFVKGGRRSAWVDYTIEVPYKMAVNAHTTSGEIRVSNIGGDGNVSSTSGDVSVRGIGGDATLHVTSGDLEATDVGGSLTLVATSGDVTVDHVGGKLIAEGTSGDLRASRIEGNAEIHMTSGDLLLDGCSGDASVRTSSGDTRLNEVEGSIDASSSSGDIQAMIVPVKGRTFKLSSSSGDVRVYYEPVRDFGFDLDVRTSSGSIEGDLPIKVSRVDRRRLQGVVASGAANLAIETASGNVTIMERDQSARK